MPNRILKESICASETLNELTDADECFFYRLVVTVDDYGNFDARLPILRSRLYPLRLDQVTDEMIQDRLTALVRVGLVVVYTVDDRPYLHLVSWMRHNEPRAKRAKYPFPDGSFVPSADACICVQMHADARISPRIRIRDPYPDPNPFVHAHADADAQTEDASAPASREDARVIVVASAEEETAPAAEAPKRIRPRAATKALTVAEQAVSDALVAEGISRPTPKNERAWGYHLRDVRSLIAEGETGETIAALVGEAKRRWSPTIAITSRALANNRHTLRASQLVGTGASSTTTRPVDVSSLATPGSAYQAYRQNRAEGGQHGRAATDQRVGVSSRSSGGA